MSNTDCDFCSGKEIPGTGTIPSLYTPIQLKLVYLTGHMPKGFGVRLEDGYMLFDNSCDEYADGTVKINYCPFCGRKIEP